MKTPTVLLLQGPYGPLFSRLADELAAQGCQVFQIALNGGDALFSKSDRRTSYQGDVDGWSAFVDDFVQEKSITDMVCFSDCRVYHKVAKKAAIKCGVQFWVLEEGYLRPDFFTLEKGGVNALSEQALSVEKLRQYDEPAQASPYKVGDTYKNRAGYAFVYYIAKRLQASKYSGYLHHRARTEWEEFWNWRLSDLRKQFYKFTEKDFFERVSDKKLFTLVLQMHEDFQLREHSPYSSMTQVINEVMTSFAANADSDITLVIKHHPMDRGFHHYGSYIAELQYSLELQGRVQYVHDVHLPTLLKASVGVVTVNSTVGLSALIYGCPVKVLGSAIYDLPEIAFQESLDLFWSKSDVPDADLVQRLVAYLRNTTQFNGSLHKNLKLSAQKIARRISLSYDAKASSDLLDVPVSSNVVRIDRK